MPLEEQTIYHSPATEPCLDRPKSSFSTVSEAATFYSAHEIPQSQFISNYENPNSIGGIKLLQKRKNSQSSVLPRLNRQDSGYAAYSGDTPSPPTSSSNFRSKTKNGSRIGSESRSPRSHRTRSTHAHPQPTNFNSQYHRQRKIHSRLVTYNNRPYNLYQQTHLTQYPSFTLCEWKAKEITSDEDFQGAFPQAPVPSTIHYWTSDNTRRLEYAAIDAASSGVRGFLFRLVPDCILPAQTRRTRFFGHDGVKGQKEGSVRRYRLTLPDETEQDGGTLDDEKKSKNCSRERGSKRPGLLRKWSTGLKFGSSLKQ
ncbi:hypothetical protein GcM1_245151 [Golovinomyces cichoracearum]|uniref:Uncharacterized protein n=1 Tax=Golovinomyces cichoracearum TaxID=62708 RepID=A0A420IFI6_9PEZI|nr:hypothetical protein GcM1_245151 [Golovinomyces cichoracearum]